MPYEIIRGESIPTLDSSNTLQLNETIKTTAPITPTLQVVSNPDLITIIFQQPWIYLLIMTAIIGYVIIRLRQDKKKPEQEAFYGVKVRANMTKKQLKDRVNVWGEKVNYKLYKGFLKVGKVLKIEPIYRINPHTELDYYNVSFRNFGIIAWIKSLIGIREHILLDPKVIKISEKEKIFRINPKAFIIEDSGVWALSTTKETELIDELNIKKDVENIKGFTSDFLRRLSNEQPTQAMITERLTLASDLEEKRRKNRISSWVKGS